MWEAWDLKLGRRVALKKLIGDPDSLTAAAAARLRREAEIGAKFQHPNLVEIYDVVGHRSPVIVMECIDGRDLKVRSGDVGIPWRILGPWVLEVVEALAHLHENGVLHRDVKPSNILISSAGVAKLGDLGIALQLGDPRLTSTGMVSGTFNYLAPETQWSFSHTEASDIWALGATILVTVAPGPSSEPSRESDLPALRERRHRRPWDTGAEVDYLTAAGLPSSAARLVSRMLSDAPGERPTAEEVRAGLRTALHDADAPSSDAAMPEGSWVGALPELLYQVFVVGDLQKRLPTTHLRPFVHWSSPGGEPMSSRLCASTIYEWWGSEGDYHPLIVVGDSGTGKTTAALMLMDRILDDRMRTGAGPLAIHVSVAGWRREWGSLREWVEKETALRTRRDPAEYASLLSSGQVVVVIDQSDELDQDELRAVVRELDEWITDDPASPRPVICCQPATLDRITNASRTISADRCTRVVIDRLDADEVEGYLRAQGSIAPDASPNTGDWAGIREHLDTPVRLVAAMDAFNGAPLDQVLTKIGPDGFWAAYYEARIRHATQSSRYEPSDIFRWLSWTATQTGHNGTFWLSDGTFTRRVRLVLMFAIGPVVGVLAALTYLVASGQAMSPSQVVAAGLVFLGPSMCLHSIGDGRMRYLRVDGRRLKLGARRGVLMGAACAGIAVIAMPTPVAIVCGTGFGLVLALRSATAVQYVSSKNAYAGRSGRDLIRNALRSGFVFGPLYGLSVGAPLAYLAGVPFGLIWALVWLCIGGQGGYLHHVLWRVKERLVNGGPPVFGLVRCLEWCITKDLLAADGASPGYRLPHEQQWSYLSTSEMLG